MELEKFGDTSNQAVLIPFTLFFAIIPPLEDIKEDELTGMQTMMPLFKKDVETDFVIAKIMNTNCLSNE